MYKVRVRVYVLMSNALGYQEVGVWKTSLDSSIPAAVYTRTHNLTAVSVLVVLTWSQAAPAGPLLHLEAIQVPPQFHYILH